MSTSFAATTIAAICASVGLAESALHALDAPSSKSAPRERYSFVIVILLAIDVF
jgi:hypothetical protein